MSSAPHGEKEREACGGVVPYSTRLTEWRRYSRLFELCMRLRYREVNGKSNDAASQVQIRSPSRAAARAVWGRPCTFGAGKGRAGLFPSHFLPQIQLTGAALEHQEMRKEMLGLSTKTERVDHVWKFKPLPSQGVEETGQHGSEDIEATPVAVDMARKGWGRWFGGSSNSS